MVGTTGADKKLFNRGALGTIIYYNSDNQKPDHLLEGEKLPQYAVFEFKSTNLVCSVPCKKETRLKLKVLSLVDILRGSLAVKISEPTRMSPTLLIW